MYFSAALPSSADRPAAGPGAAGAAQQARPGKELIAAPKGERREEPLYKGGVFRQQRTACLPGQAPHAFLELRFAPENSAAHLQRWGPDRGNLPSEAAALPGPGPLQRAARTERGSPRRWLGPARPRSSPRLAPRLRGSARTARAAAPGEAVAPGRARRRPPPAQTRDAPPSRGGGDGRRAAEGQSAGPAASPQGRAAPPVTHRRDPGQPAEPRITSGGERSAGAVTSYSAPGAVRTVEAGALPTAPGAAGETRRDERRREPS